MHSSIFRYYLYICIYIHINLKLKLNIYNFDFKIIFINLHKVDTFKVNYLAPELNSRILALL